MERRNHQVLMIKMTAPGTAGATTRRQDGCGMRIISMIFECVQDYSEHSAACDD